MKIEIELTESLVNDCALTALRSTFAAPLYESDRGAQGWETVRAEVDKQILGLNISELVRKAVESFTPMVVRDVVQTVVRDVVQAELKKAIQKAAKAAGVPIEKLIAECKGTP